MLSFVSAPPPRLLSSYRFCCCWSDLLLIRPACPSHHQPFRSCKQTHTNLREAFLPVTMLLGNGSISNKFNGSIGRRSRGAAFGEDDRWTAATRSEQEVLQPPLMLSC